MLEVFHTDIYIYIYICNIYIIYILYNVYIYTYIFGVSEQKILTAENIRRNILSKNVFSFS